MANRVFDDIDSLTKGLIKLSGSFAPDGVDAPTDLKGRGFAVTRTNVGTFKLTFTDKYVDLVSAMATLQLATAAARRVQVGSFDQSAKTLYLRVVAHGTAGNEVQNISFSNTPTAGYWTITHEGNTTGHLAADADAAAVQAALEALDSIGTGGVTVTGSAAASFDLTFAGAEAGENQPAVTADATHLLYNITEEIQNVAFSAVPDYGTWTLSFGGFTTAALPYNADATAITAALNAGTATHGVTFTVTGDYLASFDVEFTSGEGAGLDAALMTADVTGLKAVGAAVTKTITEDTAGDGDAVTKTVATTTAGVGTDDVAADANNRINFTCYFQNVSLRGA